ncbi:hypothetical protein HBH56_194840 [Parastagonospora nodorum]|uniref:Uncharacterized protein n=2 Tax=Phaeosphaeria nodorum (strain SN15 / ATCC MYA-4574 / FGSC 10173) TaxID=321614 RepID=A0A7U2I5D9_PHANO|nr:hypothetical protein HBH56_194840 [Parastagonospora nodorum]QRD00487.1 hypothetical protein JI435_090450 [Parastagonospora nodorum SN15]KAH3924870.1 hypothetical protein HBH54_188650 [Parastagonospora nodorum]KAH4131561.1 hypothetical protein HBH45_191780 [Parastagonospora nodorum]KAH4151387.1 hypothetical protein HBH44_170690 [Parastagonospora nodorum]
MTSDGNYVSVELASPTEESLPSYSSSWARDVEEKEEKKRWNWRSREDWMRVFGEARRAVKETEQNVRWSTKSDWAAAYAEAPHTFHRFMNLKTNGKWSSKAFIPSKEQIYAFLLVLALGITPMVLLGNFTHVNTGGNGDRPFYGIFQDKIQSCGQSFGTPENATVRGVEKMFVLDQTFGRFTFSQAKTIDVAWDVLIGRGVQLLAWWVGYIVFSDALLRAIERHPASFQIFQRIALEGPSLLSLWTLLKELWYAKSKRTKALFFYVWLATLYIISIPMFLSAMTGYDSTSIAWVSLDNTSNIIPAASIEYSLVATGTWNETWDDATCLDTELYNKKSEALYSRRRSCDCQLNNGTIVNITEYQQTHINSNYGYSNSFTSPEDICRFNYPGNNKTFTLGRWDLEGKTGETKKCAETYNITTHGGTFDLLDLNTTSSYCYNSKPYDYTFLSERSRCLPDTANPTYQWGFSSMLSGLFVFCHFAWALSMYAVWLDAQFCSSLVRGGYTMTPLRAAFAMARAARGRTGLGEEKLVRADTRELKQELYGSKRKRGTEVGYGIFGEGEREMGMRRRHGGKEGEVEEVEMGMRSASGSLAAR